jgi:general secretion pathway protein G
MKPVAFLLPAMLLALVACRPPALELTRTARAQADIQLIATPLSTYQSMNGAPPTTAQGLEALVSKPSSAPLPRNWQQMMESVPADPWGHPYRYEQPGKHNPASYDLWSDGPDGKSGTVDDIGNWNLK